MGAGRGSAAGFRAVFSSRLQVGGPAPRRQTRHEVRRIVAAPGMTTWLIPLWAAAEVFTTHNRPQDRRHNSPQDSARSAIRGARRGPGGLFLALSAGDPRPRRGAAETRMGLTCGGGEWREWPGLRRVGAGLVLPGAGSRGGQVVWGHWDGDRAACGFFCR